MEHDHAQLEETRKEAPKNLPEWAPHPAAARGRLAY